MASEHSFNKFDRFFRELKRRKIFRVVTVYVGAGFIILQVCDLLIPALNLPDWTLSLVFVLLAIGFFIAVITAWAFEITPEGVVRITDSEEAETAELPHGGKPFTGNRVIVTLLIIIIGLLVYPLFTSSDNPAGNTGSAGIEENKEDAAFTARLGPKSIAVLPFTYLAREDSADYFSLGMTDELLSNLAKIQDLAVIARTSVMQYRNTDKTIQEIGRELGVANLLEGSVQVVGGRVRIQAQLIEAAGGTHLWADSYTYPFENILDLQSRVTRQIARELEITLLPEDDPQLQASKRIDPAAYRLYLQGRYLRFQETISSLKQSIYILQESIKKDPNFAPAHAVLSTSSQILYYRTGTDSLLRMSGVASARALEIDSARVESQIAAGIYQVFINSDIRAGIRHLSHAVRLSPGFSNARREFGILLTRLGLFDLALPHLNKAIELDPVSAPAWGALGVLYLYMEKYEEAGHTLQKSLELNPEYHWAFSNLLQLYLDRREYGRAIDLIENKDSGELKLLEQYETAYVYLEAGKKEQAEALIRRFGLRSDASAIGHYHWAKLYTAMGKHNLALDRLQKVFEGEGTWGFPYVEPAFKPLREEPGYEQLREKYGFDPASIREYRELVQRLKSNS